MSTDYFISGGPTMFLVTPVSITAMQHLLGNKPENALWLGDPIFHGLVVERCDLNGLIRSLEYHDFEVMRWAQYEWGFKNYDLERLAEL